MGWAPGLVTTAGSLLNRVHLGWRGGSGSLKGPRNGEGGPREWGPSVSHLLRCTVEQAGDKENNLQQLSKAGRGRGGEWKPSQAACQGTGSEPRTGPHMGSDKGDGRLVLSAIGWLWGSSFCRNLSFLGLKGSPNPIPGRGARMNTSRRSPPTREQGPDEWGSPSRPAANTRP